MNHIETLQHIAANDADRHKFSVASSHVILDLLARVERLEGAKPERPTPVESDALKACRAMLRWYGAATGGDSDMREAVDAARRVVAQANAPAPVSDRERHLEGLLRRVRTFRDRLPVTLVIEIDAALDPAPDEGEAD